MCIQEYTAGLQALLRSVSETDFKLNSPEYWPAAYYNLPQQEHCLKVSTTFRILCGSHRQCFSDKDYQEPSMLFVFSLRYVDKVKIKQIKSNKKVSDFAWFSLWASSRIPALCVSFTLSVLLTPTHRRGRRALTSCAAQWRERWPTERRWYWVHGHWRVRGSRRRPPSSAPTGTNWTSSTWTDWSKPGLREKDVSVEGWKRFQSFFPQIL